MIEILAALIIRTNIDPCWDIPDEDGVVNCLTAKYGPEEIQPGESGVHWCARQRLIYAGLGGETMGCGTSGYPPDAQEYPR